MTLKLSRLFKLLRIELSHNFLNTILIIGLVFIGLTTLTIVIEAFEGANVEIDLHSMFLSITLIGGVIVGSASFGELSKRHTRINYLNLPASSVEKVLSKAITYLLLFPISVYLLFLFLSMIISGINATFLEIDSNGKFELEPIYMIAIILFTISIFFYGSVRFNTYAFPKTLLMALSVLFILGGIGFLTAYAIYPELRAVVAGDAPDMVFDGGNLEEHWVIDSIKALYFLSPLLFVTLSIFCLKEKEG